MALEPVDLYRVYFAEPVHAFRGERGDDTPERTFCVRPRETRDINKWRITIEPWLPGGGLWVCIKHADCAKVARSPVANIVSCETLAEHLAMESALRTANDKRERVRAEAIDASEPRSVA